MKVARDEHTATALPNGKILVAGGENTAGLSDARTELYNPTTKVWTLTGNLMASRDEHTAVLLQNGLVLVSGGNAINSTTTTVLHSAELYTPATGHWSTTGSMHTSRVGHTSTGLPSGLVLNAGGNNGATELSSAETYTP
jgi:N-acetylneuraminic acid mutarotase